MSPDERLCAAQPVASALGEMCYNEPQDSNNGTDVTAILNQLVEMPELWQIMSDPNLTLSMLSGFDANSTFPNVDMTFNQNFGTYGQDFSHYSDLQFNMLVNESQTPQSEAQDSPSNMVKVKTEEELWGRDRIMQRSHTLSLSTLKA